MKADEYDNMDEPEFVARCEAIIAAGVKPADCTPVQKLVRWFDAQPGNGAGGSLHIVLDDGNRSDGDVDFCIEYAQKVGDRHGELLGKVLRLCSVTQRRKVQ